MLKVISGSYPNGYFIQAQYDMLEVTAGTTVGTNGIRAGNYGQSYTSISNAGTVNGSGILFECAGTVSNTGVIVGAYGIYNVLPTSVYNDGTIGSYSGAKTLVLSGGADIVNGGYGHKNAVINGFVGISGAAGTLANFAIINGEISLNDGGAITNGAVGDQTALIDAATGIDIKGAAGTVANFGRITGYGNFRNFGVYMEAGGSVTNGAATDIGALIEAYAGVGIFGGPGSVSNLGAIISVAVGPDGYGVQMNGGGVVTNGATTDRTALISGYTGLEIQGGAGTVANFGTIIGVGVGATEAGLVLEAGGKVTNGGGHDTTALIQGATGVALDGGGTLTNFGTVNGQAASGVYLAVGGVMTNGNGADRVALITGYQGVVSAGAATLTNQGVIWGTGPGYGVSLGGGGRLTNGAVNNAGALILGYSGVLLTKGAVATNFGTIAGEGATSGYGALLSSGASLTNGAAGHTGALVEGAYGVEASSAGVTVTNFGTLSGASGVAVKFEVAGDTLAVEAGSVLVGAASGGGGTLDLASGTGTLTGLLSTGGDVKVSGAIATTTFQDFGKVDVDSDASFTLAGNGAVAAGQGLIVAGTLTAAGTISMAGSLTTTGTLAGTGTLALTGGKSAFNAGTSLTIAKITEAGATTTVTVATNLAYAGVFTQSAGTVSVSSGDKLSFSGTGDSFLGTLAGTGTVAFTGGTDALTGTTLKGTSVSIGAATVTLSGAIANASAIAVASPSVIIAAAGATLSGTGSIALSNLATNEITGVSASATLTNVSNKISGAGLIGGGKMTLINEAGGTIDGNQTTALTINTGTATITNAGLIENVGAGGTVISSAVNNTGTLYASAGTLTVNGAVSGAGQVTIANGVADFTSTLANAVTFTASSTGTLELAHSLTYAGAISGFSKTGTNFLDLADIAFISGTTKATFSGTTTSGVLTVTDGTHTSKISLTGNYTTSTFVVATDGHGGTLIHDPAKGPAASPTPAPASPPVSPWWHGPAPLVPFIGAMAGFGAGSGAASVVAGQPWSVSHPLRAPGRAALA